VKDENDNEEGEEDSLNTATTMETDSVDYPDLLNIPCASNSNSTGNATSSSIAKGRKHPFLQRSDSTLCLGCPPLDPFDTTMSEALPLADQPHLLQPHSRREDLFGVPRQTSAGVSTSFEGLPTRLGLSARNAEGQLNSSTLILGHALEQIARTHGPSTNNINTRHGGGGEPGPSKLNVSSRCMRY
jgi:E3 ubiquitin-protein ligase EDD1